MKKESRIIMKFMKKNMVNINVHKTIMIKILREIYGDSKLRNTLGFKGGTAALLFYGLPRFSVDLDFDLLDTDKKEVVFSRLKEILPKFGEIKEAAEKHYTLFFLLSYQYGERNLKIEISKRHTLNRFSPKNYLGISMLIIDKDDMAAGKLSALLTRKKFASRDLFDLWYFLENNWEVNENIVTEQTGLTIGKAIKNAEDKVKKIKKTDLLAGLGDLLDPKQKIWVKEKLKDELLFRLKLFNEINK